MLDLRRNALPHHLGMPDLVPDETKRQLRRTES
jgi:hypothetical protein